MELMPALQRKVGRKHDVKTSRRQLLCDQLGEKKKKMLINRVERLKNQTRAQIYPIN